MPMGILSQRQWRLWHHETQTGQDVEGLVWPINHGEPALGSAGPAPSGVPVYSAFLPALTESLEWSGAGVTLTLPSAQTRPCSLWDLSVWPLVHW